MAENRKRTILVIDDTPEDIAILNEELKVDYRVQAATDHEAAMNIVRSTPPPDLILLDILMPGMDGYQLCRELKAEPSTRNIPVIFVTVKDAVENEAAGFAVGCVDYITKPVNPVLVKARVKTHIDLKLAREDLEKQNEILRENARLREEVEHIGRHDLKNPLMIILNVPGMLVSKPNITPDQKKLLKMIEDAGRKMLEMINRSIDILKMENGIYEMHPASVDVIAVARQIVLANTQAAAEKNVAIELSVNGIPAGAANALTVVAEELLLYSMLANLVRNAVEACPPGGSVSLSFSSEKACVIMIHNAGAIPEKIRSRFFGKFATAEKRGGTGLGAYSAKLIATTLGGTIGFETSEDTGTTITVTLPLGSISP
jgi:two-component system sensor histidine kinase/response regulator